MGLNSFALRHRAHRRARCGLRHVLRDGSGHAAAHNHTAAVLLRGVLLSSQGQRAVLVSDTSGVVGEAGSEPILAGHAPRDEGVHYLPAGVLAGGQVGDAGL